MALSTKFTASVVAALTGALDLTTPRSDLSLTHTIRLQDGSGAGQANRIFSDQRTIAASGTEDLDLSGALTDALGTSIAMVKFKGILVRAASGNTNNVNVSRPASNGVPWLLAAGDGIPVVPGGVLLWVAPNAAGIAVTGGTGDLITFANSSSGSSVTYDVVLVGSTA